MAILYPESGFTNRRHRGGALRENRVRPGRRCVDRHHGPQAVSYRGALLGEIDELRQETARLRERMSRLGAASLRISENLDLDSVLREVVDSARVLTGAANAAITIGEQLERSGDFISSGLTPGELQSLRDLPEGGRLGEYLLWRPQPLRLNNLASHLEALNFPTAPILHRSFLGAPIRHGGVHVGNFYLANKKHGQGFTDEDEETLVLFASQAATAIANAQAYRAEQRSRADLEALVDTRAVWCGRSGGPGEEHVPQRRRPARHCHRPAVRSTSSDGRPKTHRAGAEQPVRHRRQVLSGVVSHPGRSSSRRGTRRGLGRRPGPRDTP